MPVRTCEPEELLSEGEGAIDISTGWLHRRIPVAVVVTVAVRGIRTTFGSPLYRDHVPVGDDFGRAGIACSGRHLHGQDEQTRMGQGSHTFNPVFGATRLQSL